LLPSKYCTIGMINWRQGCNQLFFSGGWQFS